MKTYSEDFYTDWLSDHIKELKDEFVELFQDKFQEYCKHQFNLAMEE